MTLTPTEQVLADAGWSEHDGVWFPATAGPGAPRINDMIDALDALPDYSDGIDPRTWREVYDAGLVTTGELIYAYTVHALETPTLPASDIRQPADPFAGIPGAHGDRDPFARPATVTAEIDRSQPATFDYTGPDYSANHVS